MKILHVTDTFLPRLGGIELHVADLAAHQQAAGHQVHVLTAERLAPAPHEPVPVHRLHSGFTGLGLGVELGSLIERHRPDLIHAHLSVGSPFTWAVLRGDHQVPAVASMHSLLPNLPPLVRAGIRVLSLPTDRITFTAVSEAAAARMRAALGPRCPVEVLHNGIDPASWAVRHQPSGSFSILSVGRLVARKRPLVLVGALAELSARQPSLNWSATLIGDGPQRDRVLAAIRRHGLSERVHLSGALTRPQISAHLARADVLVAPATLESFGLAALEARCAGVPVVGMAASGVTEFIIDEVDGLLAHRDREIATCLARLATEQGLLEGIRASISTPPAMAWETVLARHDDLYRRALMPTASHLLDAVTG